MRKEEIITLAIIILIIIGDIFTQNYTKKAMDDTSHELSDIKEKAISQQYTSQELADESKEIYSRWQIREKILAYYIEHAELEKVNTQILRMKAFFEGNVQDQCVAEIENGIYVLDHIKIKQAFSLKNVF